MPTTLIVIDYEVGFLIEPLLILSHTNIPPIGPSNSIKSCIDVISSGFKVMPSAATPAYRKIAMCLIRISMVPKS